jgi:hypothetical protein
MCVNLCQVGQKKRLMKRGPATCVCKRVAGFFLTGQTGAKKEKLFCLTISSRLLGFVLKILCTHEVIVKLKNVLNQESARHFAQVV